MAEKRLFKQLKDLLDGPALDACRLNFEMRILMGKSLQVFLDDMNNKHPLFHQRYPEIPCCECIGPNSLAASMKHRSLTQPQFMLLFNNTGSPKPNHERKSRNVVTQFCLCQFAAQKTITISALDISIISVIASRCKSSNQLNPGWLQDIRKIRNDLVHVYTNCCVDKTTFDTFWKKLETAALGFASQVSEIAEKYMRKAINDITKDYSTDDVKVVVELASSVAKHMEATEEGNAKLQTGLNGINEQLMSMGKSLKIIEKLRQELEIRDSKKSLQTPEKTDSVNQDISFEVKMNAPISNESEAIERLQNGSCDNDEEQFKLDYAGRGCLLLKMTSNRDIFKDEESLQSAISSLTERVIKAGEIDTSVEGTLKMVLTLTSPITKEERQVLSGMLSKFGVLNQTIYNRYDLQHQEENESSLIVSPDSSLTMDLAFTAKHFEELEKEDNSLDDKEELPNESQMDYLLSGKIPIEKQNITASSERNNKLEAGNVTDNNDSERRTEVDEHPKVAIYSNTSSTGYSTDEQDQGIVQSTNELYKPFDSKVEISKDTDLVSDKQESMCLIVGNITCKLNLKGISFNQDLTPETEIEESDGYLVQWIWDCPDTWDILAIVNTMNDSLYMKPHKFQTIIWSSNEKEQQLIIRTKTQREVFYSPSSVELVVHAFVSSIVNECNLRADADAVQILKISAAIMCSEKKKVTVRDEDGSDSIETNGKTKPSVLTENTVVCLHCHASFECFKCIEKGEKIKQLSEELTIKSSKHEKIEISIEMPDSKISKEGAEQETGQAYSSRKVVKRAPVKPHTSNGSLISYLRRNTFFISATMVLLVGILTYYLYDVYLQNRNVLRVITPLDVPKVNAHNSTLSHVNPQMYWGTYRANLYFGMKTRSPRSPVVGLIWFEELPGNKKRPQPNIRHWCKPNDNVLRYGWKKHDGKNFGIQEIVDTNFILTTSFIKHHNKHSGGDWSWRISVKPKTGKVSGVVSLLVYVALEGDGTLNPIIERGRMKYIDGSAPELGDFVFTFPSASQTNTTVKYSRLETHHKGFTHFEDVLMYYMTGASWNNSHFFTAFREPKISSITNLIVHQVSGVLPFEIDVVYETGKFKNKPNPYSMKNEVLTQALKVASQEFDDRFASTFNLKGKGFSLKQIDFAKAGISNLLGEISYFYGSSRVKSEYNEKFNKDPLDYWPAALYTSIPSRTYFPRGFLWNVGFDNLLISLWDPKITEDILAHWLDLLNIEGWIPREQILGEEARARVPEKFIVQDNKNANPPTIFITVKHLMRRGLTDKQFLQKIFPRLRVMFYWLNTSQAGLTPSTYYWRGRHFETREQKNPLTPSSGFDDYPRASHPNGQERHLDLRCWMALASGAMADIGKKIKSEYEVYGDTHQLLVDNEILDKYHWSSWRGMYSDVGLHYLTQDSNDSPKLRFINSFGYSSLFPLMLRIIDPDSIRLTKMITDIKKRELLWTNFGLRSLARNSSFYQLPNTDIDPPYWRGSIWINMNYLTLSGLYYYGKTPGKNEQLALDTYKELRNNIISNVIREYSKKGSLFEQYDDQTGEGKGSHPFSGWSALIVAIMAEEY